MSISDIPWPGVAAKEAKFVVHTALPFLGGQLAVSPEFQLRSGVVDFFGLEEDPLPCEEPDWVFFNFEFEEPFPDFESDLDKSDFGSALFPVLEGPDLWETAMHHSQ